MFTQFIILELWCVALASTELRQSLTVDPRV